RVLQPFPTRRSSDLTVDAINTNGPALHAVWALAGLGLLDGSHPQPLRAVMAALKHRAPGVRKAAVQALPVSMPEVVHALLNSGVDRKSTRLNSSHVK